jgi:hypothetical protein
MLNARSRQSDRLIIDVRYGSYSMRYLHKKIRLTIMNGKIINEVWIWTDNNTLKAL